MLKTVIVGASGYAGAELAALVQNHPQLELFGLYVSAGSQDAHKRFSACIPVGGQAGSAAAALDEDGMTRIQDPGRSGGAGHCSRGEWNSRPSSWPRGCKVFDLSGAFRVNDQQFYSSFYGFTHENEQWLEQAPTVWPSGMPMPSRPPS